MISDAVHSASDVLSSFIVIVGVKIASKDPDEEHPYGHERYECVAAIVLSVVLLITGVFIGKSAIEQILSGEASGSAPGLLALVAAAVSIVCKEGMYWYTRHHAKRIDSQALMANAWHHRSDALSSIGTLVGVGGAMMLGPGAVVLDPLAAIAVSVLVAVSAWELAAPAVGELLEKSLPAATEAELMRLVVEDPAVHDPHNLRTRRIGAGIAVEVHVRVDPALSVLDSHRIASGIENRIRERHGTWSHVIVHVEPDEAATTSATHRPPIR
jgi:cation diffusion facilitator family transporter